VAALTCFLVHVGTIWVHGTATEAPITEGAARRPWGDYGVAKAAIERYLLTEAAATRDVTIVHPGHISGPGRPIINPQGNLDLAIWRRLALGEPVALPNFGLETVHHVHAADVAALIRLCLDNRAAAAGEAFHAVSPRALTLRGFAEQTARWFGREPDLKCLPFDEFRRTTTEEHAQASYEHVARSHSVSIDKAWRILGYRPAYTSLKAAAESVEWLRQAGRLGPDLPPVRLSKDGS
jgi:nucleoside-diphosphate-sugar epimerase